MEALAAAAEFYKTQGILIQWDVWSIDTQHRWRGHFGDLDINEQMQDGSLGILDPAKEPELKWYFDNFKDTPTVFFIDDIDAGGWYGGNLVGAADVGGITQRRFVWIPDASLAPWIPEYGVTLAHEIGHLLGYDAHDSSGVMAVWPGVSLDAARQVESTIARMRQSNLLSNIEPTP